MPDELIASLPHDRLYAPDQDMWVRSESNGRLRLGATHLVALHGQFMYFTPRPVGTEFARDRSLGVMETAKTLVAIHAPVSGRIVEVNAAVVGSVALIETDPYGAGWMFVVAPTRFDEERDVLLDATAYAQWLAPRLAQKLAEKPIEDPDPDRLIVDPNRGY